MNVGKFDAVFGRHEALFEGGDTPTAEIARLSSDSAAVPLRLATLSPFARDAAPLLAVPAAVGSGQVAVRLSRILPHGLKARQLVHVYNVGAAPLPGPVSLVLVRLRRDIRLLTRTGLTRALPPTGSQYQD